MSNDNQNVAVKSLGMRRIHRPKSKEALIQELISDKVGVFPDIWRLLLFAAQVGFKNQSKEPLGEVDSGKGIDQTSFGNCAAWPGLLYLMALVENQDPTACLMGNARSEELRLSIFQEYAHGGLSIMEDFFESHPCDLDGILEFIDTQTKTIVGEPDLDLKI